MIAGSSSGLDQSPWSDLNLRTPVRCEGLWNGGCGVATRRFGSKSPPDATHVFGGYWEVYRMAFLSGRRVVGIPFPMYPNRFPGWSQGLGPDRGKLLILRPNDDLEFLSAVGRRDAGRAISDQSARRSGSTGSRPS